MTIELSKTVSFTYRKSIQVEIYFPILLQGTAEVFKSATGETFTTEWKIKQIMGEHKVIFTDKYFKRSYNVSDAVLNKIKKIILERWEKRVLIDVYIGDDEISLDRDYIEKMSFGEPIRETKVLASLELQEMLIRLSKNDFDFDKFMALTSTGESNDYWDEYGKGIHVNDVYGFHSDIVEENSL